MVQIITALGKTFMMDNYNYNAKTFIHVMLNYSKIPWKYQMDKKEASLNSKISIFLCMSGSAI